MAAYSARRVYWATQETVADWIPSAINTAGDFDLATDGVAVCGAAVARATLIWTTVDAWLMTYIGGDLIYSFTRAGNNCGIVSPRAAVVLDTGAYWMGVGKFFLYDGFVKTIPCEVTDYVFGDFNSLAASVVWALANPLFSEVTWFYPSGLSTACDRYVTYNYLENHWTIGSSLPRVCGVTQQAGALSPVPVLIGADGSIYDHETGNTRGTATAFLESGPIQVADGDNVVRIQRIIPDDKTAGDVAASLYSSLYPDAAETLNGPYSLLSPTSVRLTARQVRLRLSEVVATSWRVGVVRLGGILGGKR